MRYLNYNDLLPQAVTLIEHADNIVIRPVTNDEVFNGETFQGRLIVQDGQTATRVAGKNNIGANAIARGVVGDFVISGYPGHPDMLMVADTKTQIDRLNLLQRHPEYREDNQRYIKNGEQFQAINVGYGEDAQVTHPDLGAINVNSGDYVTVTRDGLHVLDISETTFRATPNGEPLIKLEEPAKNVRDLFRMVATNKASRAAVAPHIREIVAYRNQFAASLQGDTATNEQLRTLDAAIYTDPNSVDPLTNEEFKNVSKVAQSNRGGMNFAEDFPRVLGVFNHLNRVVTETNIERQATPDRKINLPHISKSMLMSQAPALTSEPLRLTFRSLFGQFTQVPLEAIELINFQSVNEAK